MRVLRVLIVDDAPTMVRLLQETVTRFGYEATAVPSGREALKLMRTGAYRLVISDWQMADMDGLELCRQIRRRCSSSYVYIILLTVRDGTQNIIDGLTAGADEFLSKPFESQELRVRLRTGERIVAQESRDVTVFALARLADSHDPETGAHVDRMREYCRVLAEHLSQQNKFSDEVDGEFVQLIYLTSPLHDIGKVGIPDSILLKPGRLSFEEFEVMKQHTVAGGMTLDSAIYANPEATFLCMARDIARSHHERYDGSGYPDGLAGEAIPLSARIVALADVYDALTTAHVYKPAFSHQEARRIIIDGDRTRYDPDVVSAFLANEDQFLAIHDRFAVREAREARVLHPQTHVLMN